MAGTVAGDVPDRADRLPVVDELLDEEENGEDPGEEGELVALEHRACAEKMAGISGRGGGYLTEC